MLLYACLEQCYIVIVHNNCMLRVSINYWTDEFTRMTSEGKKKKHVILKEIPRFITL